MRELILLFPVLFVLAAAGYAVHRAFNPPAQPSRLEGATHKKHFTLLSVAIGTLSLVYYLADSGNILALVIGVMLIVGAVYSYLRPATASLPDSERFRSYRLSALLLIAMIPTLLLMTAKPVWSDQIIRFWVVGALVMLAWGMTREILRRR